MALTRFWIALTIFQVISHFSHVSSAPCSAEDLSKIEELRDSDSFKNCMKEAAGKEGNNLTWCKIPECKKVVEEFADKLPACETSQGDLKKQFQETLEACEKAGENGNEDSHDGEGNGEGDENHGSSSHEQEEEKENGNDDHDDHSDHDDHDHHGSDSETDSDLKGATTAPPTGSSISYSPCSCTWILGLISFFCFYAL